jgi:hypothetical protein
MVSTLHSKDINLQTGLNIRPKYLLPRRNALTGKDKHRLKVKGWLKIFQAQGAWKQEVVAILIFDKSDFKPKLVRRGKEGHFILTKGTINQEDIMIENNTHRMLAYPIS